MPNMNTPRVTRRTLAAGAAGVAAGAFVTSLQHTAGQQASPVAENATPVPDLASGFVSTRIRTVESSDARAQINDLVVSEFGPDVATLDGFKGYLLGDVLESEKESLSILVLEEESQAAGFDALAADFVSGIEGSISSVGTVQWAGELLLVGRPVHGDATPVATPVGPVTGGYVAVRVYESIPGTDPHEFAPQVATGFLPIVSGIDGFQGYLLYTTNKGFISISFFDSVESAEKSNKAGREWAAEFLTEYTAGDPEIINADVVYRDMPVLR